MGATTVPAVDTWRELIFLPNIFALCSFHSTSTDLSFTKFSRGCATTWTVIYTKINDGIVFFLLGIENGIWTSVFDELQVHVRRFWNTEFEGRKAHPVSEKTPSSTPPACTFCSFLKNIPNFYQSWHCRSGARLTDAGSARSNATGDSALKRRMELLSKFKPEVTVRLRRACSTQEEIR